jgi:hypothetical protein
MRILIYTILSLALAATAFAQEGSKKAAKRDEAPAAKGTLSTPFGVAKTTHAPAPKAKTVKRLQDWKVEMDGKDFKFTKKTPFGPSSWKRAEADLTADERAVAEHSGLLEPEKEPADEVETAAKQP